MTRLTTRGRDRPAMRRKPAAMSSGLRALLPTAVPALLLAAALILPGQMFQSEATTPPIGLGPAAWPNAALAALAAFAVLWIARDLWAVRDPDRAPTLSAPVDDEEEYRYGRAVAGLALIVVYGWVLSKVGFSIATAAFIATWCWLGGVRRLGVIVPVTLIGTLAILWLFMGLALMPLPRGLGPFDAFSVWLLRAVGIY